MNPDPNIPRFGPWSAITSVMQRTTQYGDSAPNNHTIETNDGPPIVKDFYCKQPDGSYINAFYRPLSPYNWRTTPTNFALPAPDNFQDQSNTPVQFTSSTTGMGAIAGPKPMAITLVQFQIIPVRLTLPPCSNMFLVIQRFKPTLMPKMLHLSRLGIRIFKALPWGLATMVKLFTCGHLILELQTIGAKILLLWI